VLIPYTGECAVLNEKRITDRQGITLVEITIVLAVLAVMAAIAIPSYVNMLPRIELKRAATELSNVFMDSRMRSVKEVRNYTVTFDLAAEAYTVKWPEPDSTLCDTPPYFPGWAGNECRNRLSLSRRIDVYADTSDPGVASFSGSDVVFRPDGTAATAGYEAVYFRNQPPSGERYRVKVLGVTGKISVEKWKGGSWASAF
jgi:prepilin-type N-terminal cleavage/methylation domain-containing protein